MRQFNSLNSLFDHWRQEADKYAALSRLREFYDQQSAAIVEPVQQRLLEYAEQHGAASVTPEIRGSFYSQIKENMNELQQWFGRMTKEILEFYENENR